MRQTQMFQLKQPGEQGEMKELWEELLQALEDFAVVQEEHVVCLNAGKLQQLESWPDRRQRVFDRLVQCFRRIEEEKESRRRGGEELMAKVMERLRSLLAGEQELAVAAEQRREEMAGTMKAMRKGRKALRGYSLGPIMVTPEPRFLSSKS